MIWIPSETEAWEPAQVISAANDSKSIIVKLKSTNKEIKIHGELSNFDNILTGSIEENCDNLVELESFSEGIILHHIRKRFHSDEIYTLVGNILIALNPYKSISNIYNQSVIDDIYRRVKSNLVTPPHIFTIGTIAVNNMKMDSKSQSILISGESGAGKTEGTKRILQLISTICGSTASRVGASIENQIIDSNPILESFGNAKTIRNNNSSRFGKYMEVNFDKRFNIKGCMISAYLLEKSRVVKQGPQERNYHIFYMLLAGATREMRKDFNLKPPDQFNYLSQSGCLEIDRRSDSKEFEEMIFAMNNLAIETTTQTQIFQCLVAILHLGNISIIAARDVEGGSKVLAPLECKRVASLLGISPSEGLEKAVCNKTSVINGEALLIPLTPEKAVDQRDALAKYIYGRLFEYVVLRVNSSLYRGKPGSSIGVLDIFGFEVFALNSFEQLCINYCNERLQTFFNEIIFEGEMRVYASEDIPCQDICFQDNVGCVRLIDLKGAGVFTYLDEEIMLPKGSDEKFVSKLNQLFDENLATKSVYFSRSRKSALDFVIRHFAGDVCYHAKDFMDKNKDALADSLMQQVQKSSIAMILPPNNATSPDTNNPNSNKKTSKLTLAAKFKSDLDNLMTNLRLTNPQFIRCIKPNNNQTSNQFDSRLALNQLKYSGLFEAIKIRKSGYSVRIHNDVFVNRYKHCLRSVPSEIKTNVNAHCEAILIELDKHIDLDMIKGSNAFAKQWIVGKTKVFIRTIQYKLEIEKLREKFAPNTIIQLQKLVRGFITRCHLARLFVDQTTRRELEAKERKLMSVEDQASMHKELEFRNDDDLQRRIAEAKRERIRAEAERRKVITQNAATLIQKIIRGHLTFTKGRIFMCERMLELALTHRDEALMSRGIVLPDIFGVTSPLIKVYQSNAKKLILEVLNEAFIKNELKEAIQLESVDLLKVAIRKAEQAHMPYLIELQDAKHALHQAVVLRSILKNIEEFLVKCVTVPKLLASVDELQALMKQATDLGLGGEYIVQDAALRLKHVANLIQLRDRLRFAVELCSPSRIYSAMKERSKIVKIYGAELFAEEVKAAEGMIRMLSYQEHIDSSYLTNNNHIASQSTNKHDEIDGVNVSSNNNLIEDQELDMYLPVFAYQALERLRYASTTSSEDLTNALISWVKIVPDEVQRKFYFRVFKWLIAFATWKYTRDQQIQLRDLSVIIHKNEQQQPQSPTKTSMLRTTTPNNNNNNTITDLKKTSPKMNKSHGEFSMRQAKTKVLVAETLKKGKKVNRIDFTAKTDAKIKDSISEIEKFRTKVGKFATTFSG